MSRRSGSGFTGANAIPLGARNKAIGAKRSFTSSPPREEPKPPVNDSASKAFKAAQAAAASLSKLANRGAPAAGGKGINTFLCVGLHFEFSLAFSYLVFCSLPQM